VFKSIAIAGATGAVGTLILRLLEEREFPFEHLTLLASARSVGKKLSFAGKQYEVELLRPEAFDDVDLVIGSTPDDVAAEFAPWAVERGSVVVDESGYWRMDPKVPLVVPEVNPEAVESHQGIIASPNCSTTQMVVALKSGGDRMTVEYIEETGDEVTITCVWRDGKSTQRDSFVSGVLQKSASGAGFMTVGRG